MYTAVILCFLVSSLLPVFFSILHTFVVHPLRISTRLHGGSTYISHEFTARHLLGQPLAFRQALVEQVLQRVESLDRFPGGHLELEKLQELTRRTRKVHAVFMVLSNVMLLRTLKVNVDIRRLLVSRYSH